MDNSNKYFSQTPSRNNSDKKPRQFSALHSVQRPPPLPPKVYRVDPRGFRDLVQLLTGAPSPSPSSWMNNNTATTAPQFSSSISEPVQSLSFSPMSSSTSNPVAVEAQTAGNVVSGVAPEGSWDLSADDQMMCLDWLKDIDKF